MYMKKKEIIKKINKKFIKDGFIGRFQNFSSKF